MLWDNGNDYLDRAAHTWRDPTAISIHLKAVAGVTNSLPDSTEDLAATTQWTSAYIWHRVGDAVTDQSLPFLLNGNTLQSVKSSAGKTLTSGTDYAVSGANITFKASFLSTFVSPTTAPGVVGNVTLSFSTGADLILQIVQWDIPVLNSTSSAASTAAASGADLDIPITYKGLQKPATVKAVLADGTPLVDTWTVYLGPLQQARTVRSALPFLPHFFFRYLQASWYI